MEEAISKFDQKVTDLEQRVDQAAEEENYDLAEELQNELDRFLEEN